jgi:transcriptional regulator with XRE-family HTH domain
MDFMIGDNLRVLRAAKGVTQAEVAGQVGIAASTYASFERGDRPRALNEEKLEALAAYFGVPIAEILKKRAPKLAEESTAHDVAPGIPLRITLVGLGRINLGLMGPLFHRAGFEVCGVNLSHAGANRHLRTIDALRD